MHKVFDKTPILELAGQGLSASHIKEKLGLAITVRQIQRIIQKWRVMPYDIQSAV